MAPESNQHSEHAKALLAFLYVLDEDRVASYDQVEAAVHGLIEQLEALRKAAEFALPVLQAYSIHSDEEGFQTAASQMHEAHEVLARALSNPASEPLEDRDLEYDAPPWGPGKTSNQERKP